MTENAADRSSVRCATDGRGATGAIQFRVPCRAPPTMAMAHFAGFVSANIPALWTHFGMIANLTHGTVRG